MAKDIVSLDIGLSIRRKIESTNQEITLKNLQAMQVSVTGTSRNEGLASPTTAGATHSVARESRQNVQVSQPRTRYIAHFFLKIISFVGLIKAHWIFRNSTIGHGVRVKGSVDVCGHGHVYIGARTCFHRGAIATELNTQEYGVIKIGVATMINYGCIINATDRITIGDRCRIGYSVVILDSNLHEIHPTERHLRPEAKPVQIEDDVWLGTRAIILPGVRIGRGSIVAAGSIVSQDVPPMTIVAGVPAKVVRRILSAKSVSTSKDHSEKASVKGMS